MTQQQATPQPSKGRKLGWAILALAIVLIAVAVTLVLVLSGGDKSDMPKEPTGVVMVFAAAHVLAAP